MRYFLIDKVLELKTGESARGVKCVTLSDQILHDHFPDYPTMPGALILEASAQLAGFLLEMTLNKEGKPPRRALLVQIQSAKFHEAAGPGDRLDISVKLESNLDSAAQITTEVFVEEKRIVRAKMTFMMRRIDSERVHKQRRYLYQLWTRDFSPPLTIL